MRIGEAVTFSEAHIVRPDGRRAYKIRIGPEIDGCRTKYGKKRTIEVPDNLMGDLYAYKVSEQRAEYAARDPRPHDAEKPPSAARRLFLSNRGSAYSISSIESDFATVRTKIRKTGLDFQHKNHDLRRTFATNFLYEESVRCRRSFRYVAMRLMELLGHESWSSTEKYIAYLEDKYERRHNAALLNKVAGQAMGESERGEE